MQTYVDNKSELILHDKYFTESMYAQFDSQHGMTYEKFEMIITDEVIESLHENLEG